MAKTCLISSAINYSKENKIIFALLSGSTLALVLYLRKKFEKKNNRKIRCLITGFNDWRNMDKFQDIWRSDENPSSRVILGSSCSMPSILKNGPLPCILRKMNQDIDWSFQTIPTIWSTSLSLDVLYYDIVIHLGLGVYDSHKKLLLESGAYNERISAKDASGHYPYEKIIDHTNKTEPELNILQVSKSRQNIIKALNGRILPNGFIVEVADARKENTYICNETHYRSLQAVNLSETILLTKNEEENDSIRLKNAFFIHIPYPEQQDQYQTLASDIASLIAKLVEESMLLLRR